MIVVFAGKRVGAEVLEYLIARADPIGLVVASAASDERILSLCSDHGIECPIYSRELADSPVFRGRRFEWLLNCWSPHLIPASLLSQATNRLNLHPSLIPHARGSDSAAWTLRKELPAGVSLLEMTETLDAGGLYAQRTVDAKFPIRGSSLHGRLQDEIVALFQTSWPDIKAGILVAKPQIDGGSYHLRRETNADRRRDAQSVASLEDTLRWLLAHDFSPGTTAETTIGGVTYELRIEVSRKAT